MTHLGADADGCSSTDREDDHGIGNGDARYIHFEKLINKPKR